MANRLSKLILSSAIFITLAQTAWARQLVRPEALRCKEALLVSQVPKPVVSQCLGSCALEAALSNIETLLSAELKKPVSISRVYFYSRALEVRVHEYFKDILENEGRKSRRQRLREDGRSTIERDGKIVFRNNLRTVQMSDGGSVDILSSWGIASIAKMYGPNEVHRIWPAKTQLQVAREDRLVRQMVAQITRSLYEFNEKLREITPQGEDLPATEGLIKLVNIYLPSIIGEIFEYQTAALKKSRAENLHKVLDFQRRHVEFEVAANGQVYFDKTSEARIRNVIDEKHEMFLSYTHVYRAGRSGDRTGVLDIEPGETFPVLDNVTWSEAARHGVAVVGVVLDAQKRIEYLIIRNSWGSRGRTYYGHHYMTPRYLWNDSRQRLGQWVLK